MKKVYISFADEDIAAYNAVFTKLAELEADNTLLILEADHEKLSQANLIISLISPDYVWSPRVRQQETETICTKVAAGTVFIPLILSNCMWEIIPFMTWRDFPPPYAKPMDEWEDPYAALDAFTSRLTQIIDETPPLRAYG